MQMWRRIIFGMEAVTVRGLEKGGSLGGERGIWWELVEWVVVGVESGWERRKLERGLGCISVRGR